MQSTSEGWITGGKYNRTFLPGISCLAITEMASTIKSHRIVWNVLATENPGLEEDRPWRSVVRALAGKPSIPDH
ncbi:hypothetical protein HI914_05725 [Erysiphe necator]|nr:hypothetical protein HI914_05725 [Erysiphe necator]